MSRVAELLRARRASPVAVVALISAGLAGCSGDSHRFAENPFNSRQQEVTGTVPPAQAAPSGRIESRPLPQYAAHFAAAADHAGLRLSAPEPVVRHLRRRPRHRRLCAAHAPDRDDRHDRAAVDRVECELERDRRHHHHRRHQRHGRHAGAALQRSGARDHARQRPADPAQPAARPVAGHSAPGHGLLLPRCPRRRRGLRRLPQQAAFTSSIRARRCTASPARTTFRLQSSRRPTICRSPPSSRPA